jgi:hypothetical protein
MKTIFSLLSTIGFKKMISGLIMGFLLLGISAPISNYQIRALFVSLEIVERTPMVLEALTLSQLNDVVMKGFFKDNDYDQKGNPVKNNNKSKSLDTNLAYCLTGSMKRPLNIGYYILSKVFNGLCFSRIESISTIGVQYYRLSSTLPVNYYVLNLLSILTLPRCNLDVNTILVPNVIYKGVINNYLTIINPILV